MSIETRAAKIRMLVEDLHESLVEQNARGWIFDLPCLEVETGMKDGRMVVCLCLGKARSNE